MVILSCRISWITVSRSVMVCVRSTSGRAPSISSSMRFWISAVSLKRPPTLFTISSLLSASIMCVLNASRTFVLDDLDDLFDRLFQIVVDDHVVECPAALGHVDLALGGAEALLDVVRAIPRSVG